MFTGIVSDVGEITALTPGGQKGDRRFVVRTKHDLAPVPMGASIACSGCCLTVVEKGPDWFAVEASGETLDKTHLGDWTQGQKINLELKLVNRTRITAVSPAGEITRETKLDSFEGTVNVLDEGKSYSGKAHVEGGTMKLSGCALGGLICKSATLIRQ